MKIKNLPNVTLLLSLLALPVVFASSALAASTGTVAATVTPQKISVVVSDGSVSYGTLDLNATADTTASGVNDTQLATNDGNVAEDFNISSSNATGGTAWTLAGTVGADQYKHSFCNTGSGAPDSCDATPTWTTMSTSYTQLADNVAAAGTNRFDLKLDTPTTSTDYVQKTITVTVQAVAN